jgi:chloramphenicol O-acetyltransferase type A
MEDSVRIDFEHYTRKKHFDYFKNMGYPYVGVTCNVDITDFISTIKTKALPFFLSFLWCVAQAANAEPEFRQRIVNDGIIEFKNCKTSHTVAKSDGTYCYCCLNCNLPYNEFIPYAQCKQNIAKSNGDITENEEDSISLLFISTVPWISYSSLVQPVPFPADSNPRITWGRYYEQNGRVILPVSILCHHALVDGRHIAKFYDHLNSILQKSF